MASVTESIDVKSGLSRFKEYIESRDGETSAWRGEVNAPS